MGTKKNVLGPFFTYYGSKHRTISYYPHPFYRTIVEPFCGSAAYATRHYAHDVRLYDLDPIICGVWDFLIKVKRAEFQTLPLVRTIDDMPTYPEEIRNFVGFWMNPGSAAPKRSLTSWAIMNPGNSFWGAGVRDRVADQVDKIKHWTISQRSYNELPDLTATWFVDPPYDGAGQYYRYNAISYPQLAKWCEARKGHTIVCENVGATWLPFRELVNAKSSKGHSAEAIWSQFKA